MKKSFVVVCIQAVPALEEDTERLRSLYTHLSVFAHGGGRREDFPCSCPAVHGLTILQALASVLSSYWSLAVFPALGCLQPLNPSGIIVWTAQQLITTNTSLWHLPHYVIIKFKQSNFSGATRLLVLSVAGTKCCTQKSPRWASLPGVYGLSNYFFPWFQILRQEKTTVLTTYWGKTATLQRVIFLYYVFI